MSLFKKKKKEVDLEAVRDIADDIIESDFVPYACHYDPHTILTKNGELLQTIKVVGFSYEHLDSDSLSLREMLRKSILENIPSKKFALWIHTLRRKADLSPEGKFPDDFSRALDEAWRKKNDWGNKFVNELYVTVVIDGQSASLKNPKNFLRAMVGTFGPWEKRHREAFLQKAHADLDVVALKMLATLEPYGARRLAVVEREEVFYSELCEFLGKIINLRHIDMPMVEQDLSTFLPQQDVTFAHNAMEVRNFDGRRRFGSIITVKEYKELSLGSIDHFLQIPMEFVISQTLTFVNTEEVLEEYEYQDMLMKLSGDKELAQLSGLQDIMESNRESPIDYGKQQLTVFLISENVSNLEKYTGKAVGALASLGIVSIREDIKFEECYWSLLPGNFEFLTRLKPINTARVGGFANLSNFPAGRASGNHWGPAVSLMYTAARTPYFFNFHNGNVGHTTLIGHPGTGKTVLLNFLLSQSRKFRNKLFFFDHHCAAQHCLEKLGGTYYPIFPDTQKNYGKTLKINPLQLPDTPQNRNFLYFWVVAMLNRFESLTDKGFEQAIKTAITECYALPKASRSLKTLHETLAAGAPDMAVVLGAWVGEGEYAFLFDHAEDELNFSNSLVYGFNMSEIMEKGHAHIPLLYYLLHRINGELDGTPAMIVLDEAWKMLDNVLLSPNIGMWLDNLTNKNSMAIFSTSHIDTVASPVLKQQLESRIVTQLFLPDSDPSSIYQEVFGLTEKEYAYLAMMEVEERHFLLKRGNDCIVVELNLEGMEEMLPILSKTTLPTTSITDTKKESTDSVAVIPAFGGM